MTSEDLTTTLEAASQGDQHARDRLMESVYPVLRAIAAKRLAGERADPTLDPTMLVHETYLKMVDQRRADWAGRTHFLAISAQVMGRVLVDHFRHRNRVKRGGGQRPVTLCDAMDVCSSDNVDAAALSDAIEKMRAVDPRQTTIIELRMLGGLSVEEVASFLEVSARTVERDTKMGLAWLRRELDESDSSDDPRTDDTRTLA